MNRTVLILALFLCAARASAEPKAELKGIKTLKVLVEELPRVAKEFGLSAETIQTDVELRLRKAGIQVSEGFGIPSLYVNVNVLKIRGGYFAASTHLELRQGVRLERNGYFTVAATWDMGGLLLDDDVRAIRNEIGDFTDKFLNALLEANPPKQ